MLLKIKEFREEIQYTQKELAEKIGNLQRNVSNWENGVNEPDCETILKLADTFGVSIDELFGREASSLSSSKIQSVEHNILKYVNLLSETQKYALLQFLKELTNE